MKRYKLIIIGIFLFSMAFGQSDSEATELLHALQNKYDSVSSIQIDYELTVTSPEQENQVMQGILKQKDNFFMLDNEMQAVYSDGTDVWVFLKDNKEVQINSIEEDEEDMSSLSPKGLLEKYGSENYEYGITGTHNDITSIEFKPVDRDDEMSKIRMLINEKTKEIDEVSVFNKDGSLYIIKIMNTLLNKRIASDVFKFDKTKYKDIYIEDLRIE